MFLFMFLNNFNKTTKRLLLLHSVKINDTILISMLGVSNITFYKKYNLLNKLKLYPIKRTYLTPINLHFPLTFI